MSWRIVVQSERQIQIFDRSMHARNSIPTATSAITASSRTGRNFAVCSGNYIYFWETSKWGNTAVTIELELGQPDYVCFSYNATKMIIAYKNGFVYIFNISVTPSPKLFKKVKLDADIIGIFSVHQTDDHFSVVYESKVQTWKFLEMALICEFKSYGIKHFDLVSQLVVTSTEQQQILFFAFEDSYTNNIRIVKYVEEIHELKGHAAPITAIKFYGSNLLASADTSGVVIIWNPIEGKVFRKLDNKQTCLSLFFFSSTILFCGLSDRINKWNIETGTIESNIPIADAIEIKECYLH